jgi:intracellular sulfur oxidation DsrE/DsrF family protein
MSRLLVLLLALAWVPAAFAQTPTKVAPSEAAFVEHRLALQLSDSDPKKQTLILNNANNVLTFYGPDKIAIEIVTFGPGIELLREGNPNAERIRSLVKQGVRFDICNNTIEGMERQSGKTFPVSPEAHRVPAGIAQLLTLSEKGYTVLRP